MDSGQAFELIQNAAEISGTMRLDVFEFLAQYYSLIPLRGGFPAPDEPANTFKSPIENNWSQWCFTRRPFNRSDFAPERAGVACGPASGVLVLDVDDLNEFHGWCYLNDIKKPLPQTMTVKTGGEGDRYHFYYCYPEDGKRYGCRSVKGVFDIRGVGGQVLCPGSIHPETRKPYTISNEAPIAEPPEWLLEYILTRKTPADMVQTTATHTAPEQDSPMIQHPPLDINSLPVSDAIKHLIQTTTAKGQRSEVSMKVLIGLLSAGVPIQMIQQVYQQQPIGEKARENQPEWLDREILKAQEYIAQVKTQGAPPDNPFPASPNEVPPVNYRTMSALEVVNVQVDFSFLIENFWPKLEPMLITGYGGAGKSLLTLQIAMDLIHPQPPLFLDSFKVMGQHKVLFVQSENSILGIKRRLQIIRSGYNISDDVLSNRMVFLGMRNDIRATGDLMKPIFLEVIKDNIQKYETDILVLDPLISFHVLNENSNDEMRRLLDSVSLFCEANGVTPLLIHHHAKVSSEGGSGGGRGASAIGDWSANTWELSGNTTKDFKLKHVKARNFALHEELKLQLDSLRFSKSAGAVKQATTQYVIEALQNLGGTAHTMSELQDEIIKVTHAKKGSDLSKGAARNHIHKAVKEGEIKEHPGKTPNSKMYSV